MTRSVRKRLKELGYVIHTPGELFGTRKAAEGARDEDWLWRIRSTTWTVLSRDAKIRERPWELDAYRAANVHMFLLPGQARAAELVEILDRHLKEICTEATGVPPRIWMVTMSGVTPL